MNSKRRQANTGLLDTITAEIEGLVGQVDEAVYKSKLEQCHIRSLAQTVIELVLVIIPHSKH
ncbi:MAG: hypothetical protein IT321_07675 [Anaerolineae bacterium]|nr:hypothetical protein [Anaerolineae bacterium]